VLLEEQPFDVFLCKGGKMRNAIFISVLLFSLGFSSICQSLPSKSTANVFENFGLTIAKNTVSEGVPSYLYLVAPGANGVMVYDITAMDFIKDEEGNSILFDVGENPTDVGYVRWIDPQLGPQDKVFATCLNESQVDPCDSIYEFNVQDFSRPAIPHPTEETCSSDDIPLPTAIDFRADGKYGYVVKGYGGMAQNGEIYVFQPAQPDHFPPTYPPIILPPGTNPTRIDAGIYVDSNYVIYELKSAINVSPTSYYDNSSHKEALSNQVKAVETLLKSNSSANAVVSKLDAMKKDVQKWVTETAFQKRLISLIDSEKAVVLVEKQ
jgi:hypothetical protein